MLPRVDVTKNYIDVLNIVNFVTICLFSKSNITFIQYLLLFKVPLFSFSNNTIDNFFLGVWITKIVNTCH